MFPCSICWPSTLLEAVTSGQMSPLTVPHWPVVTLTRTRDVETLSRLSGVIINIAMIGLAATATHGICGPGCGQARQRSCIKYSGSPPPHFQIVQDFCTGHLQITALSEILKFRKITNPFLLCPCFQRKNSFMLHAPYASEKQ